MAETKKTDKIDINELFLVKIKNGPVHKLKYPNDGQLQLFEKKKKGSIDRYKTGKLESHSANNKVAALFWLWDILIVEVEGFTGKKWKQKVNPFHKKAVSEMLWSNVVVNADYVLREYGEDFVKEPEQGLVVYLEAYHNGKYILTSHNLQFPDEDMVLRYQTLGEIEPIQKRNKVVLTTADTTKEKIDIYNTLFIGATGYMGDNKEAIPGTHKQEVIVNVFNQTAQELIEIEGN